MCHERTKVYFTGISTLIYSNETFLQLLMVYQESIDNQRLGFLVN